MSLCEPCAGVWVGHSPSACRREELRSGARLPEIDVERWAERALTEKLALFTARRFAFDGRPRPHLRLNFAAFDESEIEEAVRRLRRALP